MKTVFLSLLLAMGYTQGVATQQKINNNLEQAFSKYLLVKNALVAGNGVDAASNATAMIALLEKINDKELNAASWNNFQTLQNTLVTQSKLIASSKDINKQREAFATLSLNMVTLAKAMPLSAQPIYVAFCPMKKSYWLSHEAAIRNPYYGNSMLTCGSVKETIQQ